MKNIYNIFGINNPPKDNTGRLLNPTHILYEEIFDEKLDLDKLCLSDMWVKHNIRSSVKEILLLNRSLAIFLKNGLMKRGLSLNLIHLWNIIDLLKAYLNFSFFEFVIDGLQREVDMKVEKNKQVNRFMEAKISGEKHYWEIVNGSSVVTETIFQKLKSFKKTFNYHLNAKVYEIHQTVSFEIFDFLWIIHYFREKVLEFILKTMDQKVKVENIIFMDTRMQYWLQLQGKSDNGLLGQIFHMQRKLLWIHWCILDQSKCFWSFPSPFGQRKIRFCQSITIPLNTKMEGQEYQMIYSEL